MTSRVKKIYSRTIEHLGMMHVVIVLVELHLNILND